jgi:hypothetical protein
MFGIGKVAGNVVGNVVKEGLGGVGKILDSVITNAEERGKIDIAFNKLQTKINEIEASKASLFVSGWRPFVGWVCGVGVGFNFVLRPLINYLLLVFSPNTPIMETLSMAELIPLLTGMLGFGAIRTYEKIKGKNRN